VLRVCCAAELTNAEWRVKLAVGDKLVIEWRPHNQLLASTMAGCHNIL
jgi:hypothetical protein